MQERRRDFDDCEDDLGIATRLGKCVVSKDHRNMIGITIGGGRNSKCPCLYVASVFEGGPVAREGSIWPGDEILEIWNRSAGGSETSRWIREDGRRVKGIERVNVARLIQTSGMAEVEITYKKLLIDPRTFFKTDLEMILKKFKHKIVDNVSSDVADLMGLSRAIIVNDPLVKRLAHLQRLSEFYSKLILMFERYEQSSEKLFELHRVFGDSLADVGARDPQKPASAAFTRIGEVHRQLAKTEDALGLQIQNSIREMRNFSSTVLPDLRMTVARYADVKHEYLSYALRLREMENEEKTFNAFGDTTPRVETGNYLYRAVLHMKNIVRKRFTEMRQVVIEKLELADKKHTEQIAKTMKHLAQSMLSTYKDCAEIMGKCTEIFPIEPDLSSTLKKIVR